MALISIIPGFQPKNDARLLARAEALRPPLIHTSIPALAGCSLNGQALSPEALCEKPLTRGDQAVLDFGRHLVGRLTLQLDCVGSHQDAPAYGYVRYQDGTPIGKRNEPFQFDPGCLMDEDGRLYLYTGFAFGGNPILLDGSAPTREDPMFFELDPADMLTVISGDELRYLDVLTGEKARGTPYEAQPFGEASSMRKFGGNTISSTAR